MVQTIFNSIFPDRKDKISLAAQKPYINGVPADQWAIEKACAEKLQASFLREEKELEFVWQAIVFNKELKKVLPELAKRASKESKVTGNVILQNSEFTFDNEVEIPRKSTLRQSKNVLPHLSSVGLC